MIAPATYTFGTFRLETARRMLFSGDESTPLPERAFQLLLLLIEAAGEVVSKETLASKVWPDSTVSNANLSQHIYLLRRLLREKATDRSYVMTVSRQGFRFAARVDAPPAGHAPPAAEAALVAVPASTPVPIATTNGAADPFREYCRGSHLLERRSAQDLWQAIEAFEKAIGVNDTCAPAFVGLARGYSLLAELGYVPAATAFQKARSAIAQAIAIDPGSAAAHAVLSEVLLFGQWDWSGARAACDHALRLDPSSTLVLQNAVRLRIALGDYAAAQTEAQRALMLDPCSAHLQMLFAQALIYGADYERAIPFLSNLIKLQPGCHTAKRHLARALILSGDPEQAMNELQLLSQATAATCTDIALLSRAFADAGFADRARQMHATLVETSATECVRVNLALSAMGIGEDREAMRHLENALRYREPGLVFLKGLRWFDAIRQTAKFAQLLEHIGPTNRSHRD
jgi:DNA-binding winged helix-turn-helix (wHTH) protein/Tfp pilus assembly protein PilF